MAQINIPNNKRIPGNPRFAYMFLKCANGGMVGPLNGLNGNQKTCIAGKHCLDYQQNEQRAQYTKMGCCICGPLCFSCRNWGHKMTTLAAE